MDPMDGVLAVLLGAEPMEDKDPMRPGMHGKMKAKGGMSAEEVLMKIDKIITCWKTGCDFESEDNKMDKEGDDYGIQGRPEEREEEDWEEDGKPKGKGKGKPEGKGRRPF